MSIDPPDLAVLERRYGGYWLIPASAWRSYYSALDDWKAERGIGFENNFDRGNQVIFDPARRAH